MDPVSIVSLVGAVVGAFGSCYSFYKDWRQKKKEKKAANHALDRSLSTSGGLVNHRYNESFALLGKDFSRGDGDISIFSLKIIIVAHDRVAGIGRMQLMQQVIALQTKLLAVFESALSNGTRTLMMDLNLAELLSTSESARKGSLDALAAQYQRLAVRRQIPRQLKPPSDQSRQQSSLPKPEEKVPKMTKGDSGSLGALAAQYQHLEIHRQASRHPMPPNHQSSRWSGPSKPEERVPKMTGGSLGTSHKGAVGSNSRGNVAVNLPEPPIPVFEKPQPLSTYATVVFNPPDRFEGKDSLDSHPNYRLFLRRLVEIGITEEQIEQHRKIIGKYYTKAKGSDSLDKGPDFEILLVNLFWA